MLDLVLCLVWFKLFEFVFELDLDYIEGCFDLVCVKGVLSL